MLSHATGRVARTVASARRCAARRRAEVLADQPRIVLSEDEAARFLDALETVDGDTVARLADLRSRS